MLNPNLLLGANVTINGNGYSLLGADTYRGFVVLGGNVAISNMFINDTRAKGGDGGISTTRGSADNNWWGGGGGGGAGLGGGLYVGAGANVTLTSVKFSLDRAVGGAGAARDGRTIAFPGGGGGGGTSANGDTSHLTYWGGGGNSFGLPGGKGGGGNGGTTDGAGPTNGGFGGGGGGGGGGNPYGQNGAGGGFGGGGGGAAAQDKCYANCNSAGPGGWGGSKGSKWTGGNGAGLGGAIFVQQGGSLTLAGETSMSNNFVSGGQNNGQTAPGLGAGQGMFFQGNGTLTFAPAAGQTQQMLDPIADQTGVLGSGGSWSLVKDGGGTTILNPAGPGIGVNQYSGGITIKAGVLQGDTSSLQGNIVDNASLVFDQATGGFFTGAISGSGVLTKLGLGALTLTNPSTSAAQTVIGAGALRVDVSTAPGSNPSIWSGAISGPGSFDKSGRGDLLLTGVNTYSGGTTIFGGRLLVDSDAQLGAAGADVTVTGGGSVSSTNNTKAGTPFSHPLIVDGQGGVDVALHPIIWSEPISGTGTFVKGGTGELELTGANTYSGGTLVAGGTVRIASDAELGAPKTAVTLNGGALHASDTFTTSRLFNLIGNGTFLVDDTKTLTITGNINDAGRGDGKSNLTKVGSGTLVLSGFADYRGNTFINGGTVVGTANSIGNNIIFDSNPNNTIPRSVTFNAARDQTFSRTITGLGSLLKTGNGALTLRGANTYSLGTTVQAGTLIGTSSSLQGDITNDAAVIFDQPSLGTYSGDLTGPGSLTKRGAGDLKTTGTLQAGANTFINDGKLSVNGSLTSPKIVVNGQNSYLAGSGEIHGNPEAINGGHIAPGNSIGTLTIDGSLTINQGVLDMEIAPGGKSDKIILTGPNGVLTFGVDTLNAIFAPGLYAPMTYTLVTTSRGVEGSIGAFTAENAPPNFLLDAYNTSNEVLLKLTAALGLGDPLSVNQQGIVGPLNTIYNATGALPSNFANLYAFSGPQLASALDQTSGEVATGARETAVQMTNQFLSLMLDPFVDGRAGTAGFDAPPVLGMTNAPPASALGYAPNDALPTHKAPLLTPVEPHWSAWAAAYGGAGHISGDPWGVGSHSLDASAGGVVAGLDYHLAPETVLGVAMGGAGGRWSLASGLGGGDTTALQVGLYGATHWGPAYVGGALSFTNHWASTNRSVLGETLTADFGAQSYGARVETGYRIATPLGAVTPYAAGQAQSFHAPGYAETGLFLDSFALGFGSATDANERSELGLRFDTLAPIGGMTVAFRARAAWAHDWFSNPSIGATFVDIPGANFVVNGVTPARDLALLSAGAEIKLAKGVSMMAKLDAELGSRSTIYGGTATLQYQF